MSDLRPIATSSAPAAIGPYSQAVAAGGWLYCSGQVGIDPATGELVEGGLEAETERVMTNLAAVLEEAGGDLSRIVRCTVFLTDLVNFAAMNAIYERRFEGHRPARVTVEVSALPKGAIVEIDAVAYLG